MKQRSSNMMHENVTLCVSMKHIIFFNLNEQATAQVNNWCLSVKYFQKIGYSTVSVNLTVSFSFTRLHNKCSSSFSVELEPLKRKTTWKFQSKGHNDPQKFGSDGNTGNKIIAMLGLSSTIYVDILLKITFNTI